MSVLTDLFILIIAQEIAAIQPEKAICGRQREDPT